MPKKLGSRLRAILNRRRKHRQDRVSGAVRIVAQTIQSCGCTKEDGEAAILKACKDRIQANGPRYGNALLVSILIQLLPIILKMFLNTSKSEYKNFLDAAPQEVAANFHTADDRRQMRAACDSYERRNMAVGSKFSEWCRAIAAILRLMAEGSDWINGK